MSENLVQHVHELEETVEPAPAHRPPQKKGGRPDAKRGRQPGKVDPTTHVSSLESIVVRRTGREDPNPLIRPVSIRRAIETTRPPLPRIECIV